MQAGVREVDYVLEVPETAEIQCLDPFSHTCVGPFQAL